MGAFDHLASIASMYELSPAAVASSRRWREMSK